jgi:chromate transporter
MSEPTLTLRQAAPVWWHIGLHSFGGPAGQIATMHRILVDERRWVSEARFLHALDYCMLLPGPEAQQLATYLGWLLHGTRGGLVAGGLFVLPGALLMGALSALYAAAHDFGPLTGALFGLKAAVLAIVGEAVHRIGKRVLHNPLMRAVAVLSFLAIALGQVPFPWVVLAAGLAGAAGSRLAPNTFVVLRSRGGGATADRALHPEAAAPPTLRRTARTVAFWLVAWWAPVGVAASLSTPEQRFGEIGVFFSQAATVTFGGAYAVLAWVAQRAVVEQAWMTPPEMLDGLGLAETTPGPLVLVLEFVGFIASYRAPGPLPPLVAGALGAALTVWATFAPSFLWIFAGAPWIEALRGRAALQGALSTITAAVVGAVANLGVFLAIHVLFRETYAWQAPWGSAVELPVLATVHLPACALTVGAAAALTRAPLGAVIAAAAAGGAVIWSLGLA